MASVVPTAAELSSLSSACNRLWELDANRLEPNVHYELNLQEGKSAFQRGDVAGEPLFAFVDPCVFDRPTYKLLFDLLDNYERGTGVAESVSAQELAENNAFLNAIVDSPPMRYAYNWLVKKNKFRGDARDFKRKLDAMWFGLYRRETRNDSSGFEHVFVGEERNGKIMGCHNWIQVYNEERRGRLDYQGYVRPKQRGRRFVEPHNLEQLVTVQFKWGRELKAVSTSLVGVSPEFEMALYSLCFLNGAEENHVQLGPYRCNIKCFAFGRGGDAKVGSAFPEALPMTDEQAAVRLQAMVRGHQTRHRGGGGGGGGPRHAPPPPPLDSWGPPPGQAAAAAAPRSARAPQTNAWGKPLVISSSSSSSRTTTTTTTTTTHSAQAPAGGAWAQPHKW